MTEKLCPSCSDDGGYGDAEPGCIYRCCACRATWSPRPGGRPVTSRFGNWMQRLKVRLTS